VAAKNSHLIELKNISKAFGGIAVLKSVSLNLRQGVIHGLVGGNGAGKSTLMKDLAGVYN
jgi:ABC-type sugar transport system ATPase subunit